MIAEIAGAAKRGHADYRDTKMLAVREAGAPADVPPVLEIIRGDEIEHEVVPRHDLRRYCDGLAGTDVEILVYHSDAWRRAFSVADAEKSPPGPGDAKRAFADGDPAASEVLSTLAVGADGGLAAVISGYVYESGLPAFAAEEYDKLLDSTVVDDLRQAFREISRSDSATDGSAE
jgi:hypothetical protein